MNELQTAQPFFGVTAPEEALAKSTAPLSAGNQRLAAYVSDLLTKAQRSEMEDACAHATAAAECELYSQAIHRAQGDQSKAAKWLGVSRPTMRKKLLRYGVHPRLESVAP
jgi:DNA-binding protein Fis